MSNQPRSRPWFRFGSSTQPVPVPAPSPQTQSQAPPSQSRPPVRPLFSQTFKPPAAQPAPAQDKPPSAVVASPPQVLAGASRPQRSTVPPRLPLPSSVPETRPASVSHSKENGPNPSVTSVRKTTTSFTEAAPKSAMTTADQLPPKPSVTTYRSSSNAPPQPTTQKSFPLEAEKKMVLVKERIDKPRPLLEADKGEVKKSHIEKETREKDGQVKEYASNTEEVGSTRIITIAGENKGALMAVGHRVIDTETKPRDNEGISRLMKNNGHDKVMGNGSELPVYVNSNVQGVNNSILYNSSCCYNNPGVHYSYTKKALNGQGDHLSYGPGTSKQSRIKRGGN